MCIAVEGWITIIHQVDVHLHIPIDFSIKTDENGIPTETTGKTQPKKPTQTSNGPDKTLGHYKFRRVDVQRVDYGTRTNKLPNRTPEAPSRTP